MSSAPYSEEVLITLLRKKNEEAFRYLYDHYAAALYGVVLKVVNEQELANDLLQEIFVKIWNRIDSYDPQKGRLFTWMLHIARNTAIDMLRSKTYHQQEKNQSLESNVHIGNSIQMSSSMMVDQMGLKNVLNMLSEEQRMLIEKAYFRGYTQEEIAKELQVPLGTVKTRIRNALLKLREILQEKRT
ncbi:RNA polymerase sigma factor [Thermoflavifilum thermophilum]|uniref:RNA polymerase sigma-70 factor, ECF subfamily n=1 Tax=Thermoflavifilum thermophilum TaxID=1393122 RepID=A0A1I7NGJ1_9BACT|nr:sigma-70 family RNA polymerase sigma factor [Thermoflavifilum thermophilum]SFV33758.1 RNA polymerase sigma-70 factor, ECF subfamily [Thermoflavifilum thermophilum]